MTVATDDRPAESGSDPVVDAYKKDIDRTLIRENLTRTPEERLRQLMKLQEFAEALQAAGRVKDMEAIAELEAIREERRARGIRHSIGIALAILDVIMAT